MIYFRALYPQFFSFEYLSIATGSKSILKSDGTSQFSWLEKISLFEWSDSHFLSVKRNYNVYSTCSYQEIAALQGDNGFILNIVFQCLHISQRVKMIYYLSFGRAI